MLFSRKVKKLSDEITSHLCTLLSGQPRHVDANGLINKYPNLIESLENLQTKLTDIQSSSVLSVPESTSNSLIADLKDCYDSSKVLWMNDRNVAVPAVKKIVY